MELIFKGVRYANAFCDMVTGSTTAHFDIPEVVKKQMLEDFPKLFEEAEGIYVPEVDGQEELVEDAEEFVVETPEDSMLIEAPESKFGKMRKK